MLSREPATEQETQWAYDLVDILAKLGKTRKDIAEGSNLSSSTIARLANRKVHPTKNVWEKLYEYGRQVDREMHTRQMMTDDSEPPLLNHGSGGASELLRLNRDARNYAILLPGNNRLT